MHNRLPRRIALGLSLLCLIPFAHAEDLLKPAANPPAAVPVAPQMSAEELKAAGEHATQAAAKLGWRIGSQAWSFNKGTFFQAVDQVQALGLHYIEAYPGQVVDADKNVKMDQNMSPDVRAAIKKKLADAGIKLGSFGVTGIPEKEADARKMFEWAKDMGIETLVSEPKFEQFDLLNKLVDEYDINVAIHNHPKNNIYWNPDTEVKVLEGRSKRIGSCSDVGHWQRSGVQPVEALKKLEGRIIETHFKDLNKFGEDKAVDVPWGTGTGDVPAMLAEFKRQNGKFTFLIEYENWNPSPPQRVQQIAQGLKFFGDVCDQMAK